MTEHDSTNPPFPNDTLSITQLTDYSKLRAQSLPVKNYPSHIYSAFEYIPEKPIRRMDTTLRSKITNQLAELLYTGLQSEQQVLPVDATMQSYVSFTNSMDHWLQSPTPFKLLQVTDGTNIITRSTDACAQFIFCVVYAWTVDQPDTLIFSVFNVDTKTTTHPYAVTKQLPIDKE